MVNEKAKRLVGTLNSILEATDMELVANMYSETEVCLEQNGHVRFIIGDTGKGWNVDKVIHDESDDSYTRKPSDKTSAILTKYCY